MKKMNVWLLAILVAPVWFSCDDDDAVDTTAPTITLEDPVSGEAIAAGTTMEVHGDLEDDVDLATYSITIHDNFDGHAHGRMQSKFSFSESYETEGTNVHMHQEIEIPATVTAGPYHFIVQAIDAAGNSTSFQDDSNVEVEIWITNEEMGHITFTDANDVEIEELEGVVGQALEVDGYVLDESGTLAHIDISVGHLDEEEGDHDGHNHGRVLEDAIYDKEFDVEGEGMVQFRNLLANESIVVSQSDLDELEEGEHLHLIVRVEDADGNISRGTIEIHFD
ncbi:MAG: DUF4625 domain-containing protein [Reichenbachiella sp.]|uniref:DUF4625 domain-containing protein n=1 Tax=Reichenbachiella sp. TaxID=2184521 RepID=UPI0032970A61